MSTIKLNGREYRAIKHSTIEHDFWMMDLIRAAGLDRVILEQDETPQAFAERLLNMVIGTGHAFALLGGLMVPCGNPDIDWTPAMADEIAAHIKLTTDPNEKAEIRNQLVALLIGFFNAGLIVLTSSPSYSASPSAAPAETSTESGDTTTTATGAS